MLNYNPIEFFIYPTWISPLSVVQYFFYIPYTNAQIYDITKNRAQSYTLTVISAATAGYLYEVPMCLMRGGVIDLFRTAKNSPFIVDFGMVSFFVFICLLLYSKPVINPAMIYGSGFYLLYVVAYFAFYPEPYLSLFYITGIRTIIYRRIPSFIVTYVFATSVYKVKNLDKYI